MADKQTDITLYIGISVAIVVFGVVAAVLVRQFRRKGRDHSLYNMAANGKYSISSRKVYEKERRGIYIIFFYDWVPL